MFVLQVLEGEFQDGESVLHLFFQTLPAVGPDVCVRVMHGRQQGNRERAVEMFHRARDSGASGEEFETMLAWVELTAYLSDAP